MMQGFFCKKKSTNSSGNKNERGQFLSAELALVLAEEDLGEGVAEVGTEYRVDHRVEERVQVAEPQKNGYDWRAH